MSQTKVWYVDLDNVTREATNATTQQGCGKNKRLYVGRDTTSGIHYKYAAYLRFNLDWAQVGKIVAAYLVLYSDDQNGKFNPPGDKDTPKIIVRRCTDGFSGGTNADEVWDAGDWTVGGTTTSDQVTKVMSEAPGGLTKINITEIVEDWAPTTVSRHDTGKGSAVHNYGLKLVCADYSDEVSRWSGWSNSATDAGVRPTIELVYEYGATTPNVPANLSPSGSVATLYSFDADFSDVKATDKVAYSEVEVYPSTATNSGQTVTGTRIWQERQKCSNSETVAGRSNLVPTVMDIKAGTTYKWRVRQTDQEGQTSQWTNLTAFSLVNTPPDAPVLPNLTTASLRGMSLEPSSPFSDPDASDTLGAFQVQLSVYPSGDAHWLDAEFLIWDTGRVTATSLTEWYADYAGPGLAAGTYYYRARVWDNREGVSAWAYATITLTATFDEEPGAQSTIQIDTHVPWRIILRGMHSNGKRGPGSIVGILENAKSVGASIMYNSPGELHFTLPVDHPQVSVIEPRQTHYAVELYSGDGWREVYAGLVMDYDANERDVIFYGVDYLGLFNYIYDERYDPANPELAYNVTSTACPDGGSKYIAKRIDFVVQNQIERAIGLTDSPVGFLTVGSIASMPNRVTVYSTMQNTLQFCASLIDSHRQGQGARTRMQVYKTGGAYKVRVVDNPERTRDALRLKYGELVQGYRVIPFGPNWASIQHAIGRTREGIKVMYKTGSAPGIDTAVWGRFAQVQVFEDVNDENDLLRRLKQAAIKAGKLGKQIGLGVRSGVLQPLDGYDVTDSIPVEIVHGVVDTTAFGSGYWVCWGVAWEASDNGETQTILTLLPREDTSSPDPDLIPENPISVTPEWQVGWTSPNPAVATGKYWLDQTTGIVYQRQDDGTYTAISSGAMTPPTTPGTPASPSLTSSLINSIVTMKVTL